MALPAAVGLLSSAPLGAIRDAIQDAPHTANSNSTGATGNATGPNEMDSMASGDAIRHARSGRCTSGAEKVNHRLRMRRQRAAQIVITVHQ